MKIDGGVTLDVRFASEAAAGSSTASNGTTSAGAAGTHAATPARLSAVAAAQVSSLLADPPALPSWKAMISRLGQGLIAMPAPSRGYAPEPALVQLPASSEKAVSAKVTVTSPLDFLRDSRLTAEEKLVLLLAQQQKDVEKEIDTVLKKAEAKSAQKQKSSGGGPAGLVGSVIRSIPGVGVFDAMGLSKLVDDVAKATGKAISELSGPVLAAGATALGMPHLAPLAMTYGSKIVEAALDADASAEPKATNAPNAGTGSSAALDPVETQRLTLLVNRQQQWSGTVSNLLHSIHQTRMSVIQNLR